MRNALAFLILFGVIGPVVSAAGSDSGDAVVTTADMKEAMKNAKVNPGAVPGTFDQMPRVVDTGRCACWGGDHSAESNPRIRTLWFTLK